MVQDPGGGYNHWYISKYYDDPQMQTKFHKWRVDIYRYDDGINTNKIEYFLMMSIYLEFSLLEKFWLVQTRILVSHNKNPQVFGSGDKGVFFNNEHCYGRMYIHKQVLFHQALIMLKWLLRVLPMRFLA